jgi:hypothetical protein
MCQNQRPEPLLYTSCFEYCEAERAWCDQARPNWLAECCIENGGRKKIEVNDNTVCTRTALHGSTESSAAAALSALSTRTVAQRAR